MKIIRTVTPEITIQEFADRHRLVMSTRRVKRKGGDNRYEYRASFQNCSIETYSGVLFIEGRGDTEEEAIAAYASVITLERVLNRGTGHCILVDILDGR